MPLAGYDVAVYVTESATGTITNEYMSEVDETWLGRPRYSVYEIADSDKRYLSTAEIPTFEKSDDGLEWDEIEEDDIAEIQYAGGRVVLKSPLTGAYYVRCASGKYYNSVRELLGANASKLSLKTNTVDVTTFKSEAVTYYPTLTDISFTVDAYVISENSPSQQEFLDGVAGERMIAILYLSETDDMRLEGYVRMEGQDINIEAKDVVRGSLTFVSDGKMYIHK